MTINKLNEKSVGDSALFGGIVLDQVEHYDASRLDCYAFRRGSDVRGGYSLALGNMVNGFPFEIQGVRFANSELAYICGCFSLNNKDHCQLQEALVQCNNGLLAKRAIRKPNSALIRADWKEFNIQWMLYVVWRKVKGNADFRQLLMALPEDGVIIEDSTFQNGRTAEVWGTRNNSLKGFIKAYKGELQEAGLCKGAIKKHCDAKRLGEWSHKGEFVGKNLMGKILMICVSAVRKGLEPPIDYALLREKNIYLLGKLLTFK